MFRIQTLNKISAKGLDLFPRDNYEVASELPRPDAIVVRSADMHSIEIPDTVKAIARAGAGYNNIPVDECSKRGIVVFNTPGANANAVKEETILAMLMSGRHIYSGIQWCKTLADKADEAPDLVEKGKSKFVGPEIRGKTLGVIGLGAIGVMVANDALSLGMQVIGYDPFISVDAAWNLSRQVQHAESLETVLAKADYLTIHVPLSDQTRGMMNAEKIRMMKPGARLINLARGGLVVDDDVIDAMKSGKLGCYVTDFPDAELIKASQICRIICIPHLGASTPEAEDNCAAMAVQQIMAFLEKGEIKNSVNFPRCSLEQKSAYRLLVANRNIPNMVGQMTTLLAGRGVNITDLINQSRGDIAYNILDTDQPIPPDILEKFSQVEGIIKVRMVNKDV